MTQNSTIPEHVPHEENIIQICTIPKHVANEGKNYTKFHNNKAYYTHRKI